MKATRSNVFAQGTFSWLGIDKPNGIVHDPALRTKRANSVGAAKHDMLAVPATDSKPGMTNKAPGTFEITSRDEESSARCGVLHTAHGTVQTPVFMPVGTQATVKSMRPHDIKDLGFEILLGNTYHLEERPGSALIDRMGKLHKFMAWDGAILTDSGGFQVWSLADLNQITEEGVTFKSHLNGAKRFMGPVESMAIQANLGSDIAMLFDECIPYPAEKSYAEAAVQRTLRWARALSV